MSNKDVIGQLESTGGEMNIEWKIVDFLSLPANVNKRYDSPTFFYCDSSWYIQLYPNGQKAYSSEEYLGMYLVREDSGPPVHVTYSLFIKKTDGREEVFSEFKYLFKEKNNGYGKAKGMLRSELIKSESMFMPTGIFTVICTLKCDGTREFKADEAIRRVMNDCITSAEVSTQIEADFADEVPRRATKDSISSAEVSTETEADVGIEKLLSDLKSLVVSGDESDVTLKVQGEELQLHRGILAARSPVFNSMFKQNMKEKATGVVSVDDSEAGPFRTFVHYLYTGSTEELSPMNVFSLYKMADKYQVDELKASCLDFMKRTLSVETFCDTLGLALLHEEKDLLEQATDFLSENASDIMGSEDWQNLLISNPKQISDLLMQIVTKNSKKTNRCCKKNDPKTYAFVKYCMVQTIAKAM